MIRVFKPNVERLTFNPIDEHQIDLKVSIQRAGKSGSQRSILRSRIDIGGFFNETGTS